MDDRGYFVTEMVYEEVPDDEAGADEVVSAVKSVEPMKRTMTENTNKENTVNAAAAEKKAAGADKEKGLKVQSSAKTAPKKADPKPSGGQQKSMMSFFAKK